MTNKAACSDSRAPSPKESDDLKPSCSDRTVAAGGINVKARQDRHVRAHQRSDYARRPICRLGAHGPGRTRSAEGVHLARRVVRRCPRGQRMEGVVARRRPRQRRSLPQAALLQAANEQRRSTTCPASASITCPTAASRIRGKAPAIRFAIEDIIEPKLLVMNKIGRL